MGFSIAVAELVARFFINISGQWIYDEHGANSAGLTIEQKVSIYAWWFLIVYLTFPIGDVLLFSKFSDAGSRNRTLAEDMLLLWKVLVDPGRLNE